MEKNNDDRNNVNGPVTMREEDDNDPEVKGLYTLYLSLCLDTWGDRLWYCQQTATVFQIYVSVLSQPNSTLNQVGSDKVMGWPTPHHPLKLLRHFQIIQEAGFRYVTLFTPN